VVRWERQRAAGNGSAERGGGVFIGPKYPESALQKMRRGGSLVCGGVLRAFAGA